MYKTILFIAVMVIFTGCNSKSEKQQCVDVCVRQDLFVKCFKPGDLMDHCNRKCAFRKEKYGK